MVMLLQKIKQECRDQRLDMIWRGCGEEEGANPVVALSRQEMVLLPLLAPAQRYAVLNTGNTGGKHKGRRVAAPVAGDGIDDGTAQALRLQGRRPRTASGQVLGTALPYSVIPVDDINQGRSYSAQESSGGYAPGASYPLGLCRIRFAKYLLLLQALCRYFVGLWSNEDARVATLQFEQRGFIKSPCALEPPLRTKPSSVLQPHHFDPQQGLRSFYLFRVYVLLTFVFN